MTTEPALEQYKLAQTRKNGGDWFLWIACLSLINTILYVTNTQFNFIFGLGITQLIDGLVTEAAPVIRGVAIFLDILIAGAFVGIWYLAKRHTWPFITGMVFYAGDALIFVIAGEWLGLAFHVFAFFVMMAGYKAAVKLAELPAGEVGVVQAPAAQVPQAPAV